MSATIFTPEILQTLAKHEHGTRQKYASGCRCLLCRAAAADYRKLCHHRKKQGISDPIVPAFPVVEHLRSLSRNGVGYRSVVAVTGIHMATLQRIKSGQRRYIKKSSAQRILAVTVDAVADSGRVDAAHTYRLVDQLLREGFTYRELSKRSGVACSVLSHRRGFVRAKTQMKIEKFYKKIMAEEKLAA